MQNGYNEPYRVRKEHHVLHRVVLVVVLVVVAYAACVGVSSYRLYASATELRNQYTELTRDMSNHDYDSAATVALSMNDTSAELVSESEGWPWQIASKLSFAQDDVSVVQGLALCARNLTDGALRPVAEAYQTLVSDGVVQNGSVSVRALASHQDDVAQLQEAAASARSTLATCEAQVAALPASHLGPLNDIKDSLASSLSEATDAFGSLGSTASSSSVLSLLS